MIAVSLMFGVCMTASLFMIAYALQNPQLVAVAREELAALFFSVFIILFWLTADGLLNAAASGLLLSTIPSDVAAQISPCVSGPTCPTSLTSSHITLALASQEIVYQRLKATYTDLYLYEALIGFLSTISFPLGSPLPAINLISFSIAPFTGLVLLSNAHTVVVEAIGYMIPVVWAKEFILMFTQDAIPLLFLPLGLTMRAFPFFRTTGSSIIALCFALYFVFPFAVILSNYLIFDIFQPADFAYTPASVSAFGTERSKEDIGSDFDEGRDRVSDELLGPLGAPDVAASASTQEECTGNSIVHLLCSAQNILENAWNGIVGFVKTIWNIWKFMMGFTGDFFRTLFTNPLMPGSPSAGLFYFIIAEVANVSPIIILIAMTTVIEIIITVTMYRNIALLIGGEAEIVGITKIV